MAASSFFNEYEETKKKSKLEKEKKPVLPKNS